MGTQPLPQRGAAPQFSAHVYCGQTVAHLSNCWALVQNACRPMCPSMSDINAVSFAIFLDPLFLSSLCFNCVLLTIQSSEFSICQTCKITLDHLLCRKARLQAYWLPCHSFINILMSQAYWEQQELVTTLIVSSETIRCHRYATSFFLQIPKKNSPPSPPPFIGRFAGELGSAVSLRFSTSTLWKRTFRAS